MHLMHGRHARKALLSHCDFARQLGGARGRLDRRRVAKIHTRIGFSNAAFAKEAKAGGRRADQRECRRARKGERKIAALARQRRRHLNAGDKTATARLNAESMAMERARTNKRNCRRNMSLLRSWRSRKEKRPFRPAGTFGIRKRSPRPNQNQIFNSLRPRFSAMATDADQAALASVDSASAAAAAASAAIGSSSSSTHKQRPIDATIAALIISHYEGDRDEQGACHGEGHADFRDGYVRAVAPWYSWLVHLVLRERCHLFKCNSCPTSFEPANLVSLQQFAVPRPVDARRHARSRLLRVARQDAV